LTGCAAKRATSVCAIAASTQATSSAEGRCNQPCQGKRPNITSSRTKKSAASGNFCGNDAIRRARAFAENACTAAPSSNTAPEDGNNSPPSKRINVDLPAPLCPITP